jgi:hypothetical protein
MTDQAPESPAPSDSYALRLAAIGLADGSRTRLETDIAAAKKKWATKLEAATKAFTEAKPKSAGDTSNVKTRWIALYEADAERTKVEAAKDRELDALKAKYKKADGHFWTLIRTKVELSQVPLALGEHNLDGFGLPTEAAVGVARAIAEVEAAGGTLSADEQRLRARLQASGVVFSLDDEEPVEAEDDAAEDEDASDEDEEPEPANEPRLAVAQ